MFRQANAMALVSLMALGALAVASAAEPKASETKQIANSIGMKLTLIPSGEFMMGSKESTEETAAFFNKTYGQNWTSANTFKREHPRHRVRITKPFYTLRGEE